MANNSKKYASLATLQTFLDNLRSTFASLTHKHKIGDLTDYTVDSSLSFTSTNPVQNKILNAEFDEIATSMNALDLAIDGKANATHNHTISDVEDLQVVLDNKSDISHTHSYDDLRNKPFYEGVDYSSVFSNGSSTVNFYEWGGGVYGAAMTDAPKQLTQDVSCKVIWDGVEYTMTSDFAGNNEAGNPIISIGAPYGDYSDYPFGIDTYKTASGSYEFSIHTNSTASTHTVDILEYGSKFVTLDEKFIPDTIARTIDVDEAIEDLETAISGKANASHSHDDRYFTETEINTKLASKSDTTHNHDSKYDSKGSSAAVQENLDAVSDALDNHATNTDIHVTITNKSNWNAAYTHSTSAHARTDATKVEDSTTNGNIKINGTETNVYSHPNSGVTAGTYKSVTVNAQGHITTGSNPTTLSGYGITDAETKTDASKKLTEAKTYADSAANAVKNDLLNGAGEAYDTLKELGDLIVGNADAIDALETIAAGKADKSHTHTIANVTNLQSALDGKANSSHGTHVSYSTTAPVMDGTASVGTASTVARSDHKHPTDTSRASQSDLDALETVVSGKANSSHTHTIANVTNLQSTLDGKAASSHTHNYAGSSSVGGAATSANKVNSSLTVKLNGGTTEGTNLFTFNGSAAKSVNITPSAIGAAASSHTHDDRYYTESEVDSKLSGKANTSHGNHVPTTQTANNATFLRNDNTWQKVTPANIGAAASSHTHTVANITDLTATATELNYMDGVTSNVQTQLDAKQASITGGASTITSSNLTANRALISNGSGKVAVSAVTNTELGYLDGVTSNIQTQLNGKESVISWSAVTQGLTWSRICLVKATTSVVGWSGILSVGFTRGNVVGNATFAINASHSSTVHITQLSANKYTTFQIRGVTDSNATNTYIEIYDNANSIASGTNQTMYCKFIPLLGCSVTKYTSFTSGATIPSGYTAGTALTVDVSGGSMVASKFVGNLSGNAATATKATQDGSGNVIISTYETKTSASAKLTEAKTYTDSVASGKANSSHNHAASNITSGTLSSDRLPTVPIAKGGTGATTAAAALTNLGITATAAELNKLDGVTATTAELNYVDGVTSNIQTQLDGKAASSHGTHVTWATSAPKANGTAAVGTVARVAREDHVHPLQTTVSGNAGSATTISKRIKITSSQSGNANKYIKFGTATLPNAYSSFTGYLIFNPTESNAGASGILHLHIRNGANNTSTSCVMKWITLENPKWEKTVSAVKVSDGVFDFYYKPINTWDTMEIIAIAGDGHGTLALANSGTYVDSITAAYTSSVGGYVANAKNGVPVVTTAGTGAAYTATIDGITELTDGLRITIIPHTNATTIYCTLNVNGLGAKNVFRRRFDNSSRVYQGSAMWLMSGTPISLTYSAMFGSWMSDLNAANADDIQGLVPVRTGGTGTGSFTKDYFLVGNGTNPVVAKSATEVMSMIGAASVSAISTAEYNELEATGATNANTLYMLTDAEEEEEVLITTDDIDTICGATV